MAPVRWSRSCASRATSSPSGELVELLQRAIGHVVKVIEHADDSDGTIGDLARELLELHATAWIAAWWIR